LEQKDRAFANIYYAIPFAGTEKKKWWYEGDGGGGRAAGDVKGGDNDSGGSKSIGCILPWKVGKKGGIGRGGRCGGGKALRAGQGQNSHGVGEGGVKERNEGKAGGLGKLRVRRRT